MKAVVLIGSGDTEFFLLFAHILEVGGYHPKLASGVSELIQLADDRDVKVIMLDCQPGRFSAIEACQAIKQTPALTGVLTVAIIEAGAKDWYLDLIAVGVDEAFVRPFPPAMLLDYFHRHLTRNTRCSSDRGRLEHSRVAVDFDNRRVTRNGVSIHLAGTEFTLLIYLMKNANRICSRMELLDAAWPGRRYVQESTLTVHVGRLRKALNATGGTDLIRTVRSIGYAFGDAPAPVVQQRKGL